MYIKRYLVILADYGNCGSILELPHASFEEAWDALTAEFLRTVSRVGGMPKTIHFDGEGNVVKAGKGENLYALEKEGKEGPSFYVTDSRTGNTCTGVIREMTVHFTSTELELAFREREHQYLLMDAEDAFYKHVGYDPDAKEDSYKATVNNAVCQIFEDRYGFSLSEAINDSSEFFLLDRFTKRFEKHKDANLASNDVWPEAIREVLEGLEN